MSIPQTRTSDDHFLGSGDKVTCFFEEDAFDEEGQLKVDKDRAINKLGHGAYLAMPLCWCVAPTRRSADIHVADLASMWQLYTTWNRCLRRLPTHRVQQPYAAASGTSCLGWCKACTSSRFVAALALVQLDLLPARTPGPS